MNIWVDAQLSPALAPWLLDGFEVEAHAIRDLGLRDAKDHQIFTAARDADAVIMSKDSDFVVLLDRLGPPPRVIWITCGNTSNARLRQILSRSMPKAIELLRQGEEMVEIGDAP